MNLNSELRSIFASQEEKVKFHQLMALLKPHLRESGPLLLTITVKRGTLEPVRQFYKLPVSLNSETFKKALGFLMEHNFSFEQDSRAGQDESLASSKQAAIQSGAADPKDKQQSS